LDIDLVALIVGILGPIVGLAIAILGLRKARAETHLTKMQGVDTFAESIAKFIANQDKLQEENTTLYRRNVALEKMLTDADRTRTTLTDRLTDRDTQLKNLGEHLKTLQDQNKQADITQALVSQQQAIIKISQSYQAIIEEREKTMAAREQTFKEFAARTGPLKLK